VIRSNGEEKACDISSNSVDVLLYKIRTRVSPDFGCHGEAIVYSYIEFASCGSDCARGSESGDTSVASEAALEDDSTGP
jgi:hypothetical protein